MKKKMIIPLITIVLVLLTILITFYVKKLNTIKEIKKQIKRFAYLLNFLSSVL